jgi:hypothetical protein
MKMKLRNLCLSLCAVLVAFAATEAQAQESPRVGFKGGLNLSNLYVNDVDDENARFGWHAGFFTQLFSSEAFAIQPEINYSTKGSGITYASAGPNGISIDHDQRFNLAYLDIPVLAVFKLGKAAEIQAGPYWSYLLRAEIKNKNENTNNDFHTIDRRNFDDWDYGLVGGIGFNLGDAAQLGARYSYGLNAIADSPGGRAILGNAKNQVAQLYLSFNLNHNRTDLDD